MPCGWECGTLLTARSVRRHFAVCVNRPKGSVEGTLPSRKQGLPCWLYIAIASDQQYLKIGRTCAINLSRRLGALGRGLPATHDLTFQFLAVWRSTFEQEPLLCERFAAHRLSFGVEWFTVHQDILDHAASIGVQADETNGIHRDGTYLYYSQYRDAMKDLGRQPQWGYDENKRLVYNSTANADSRIRVVYDDPDFQA